MKIGYNLTRLISNNVRRYFFKWLILSKPVLAILLLLISIAMLGYTSSCNKTATNILTGSSARGDAAKLLWVTQPASQQNAGSNWSTFTVEVVNTYNSRMVFDNTTIITLSIVNGTSTFATGITATVSAGMATFSTTTYNKAETINIAATAVGLSDTPATNNIVVNALAASKLLFVQQPTNTIPGAAFNPVVTVEITDSYGNRIVSATNNVTLTISAGGTLGGGNTTVAAVSGLATFTGVTVTGAVQLGYTLTANASGLTNATSNPFAISGIKLLFVQQPTDTAVGVEFNPVVTVEITDINNNRVTTASNNVTLTISAGGTLGGTTTVAAVSGLATFTGITVAGLAQSGYTLITTNTDSFGNTTSNAFAITGFGTKAKLLWVTQPNTTQTAGAVWLPNNISVRITDAFSNTVTSASDSITLTKVSGTAGPFVSGATVSAIDGVVTFTSATVNIAGTITVNATSGTLIAAPNTGTITVNPAAANKLLWVTSPGTSQTAGTNWAAFSIEITDAYGNRRKSDNTTAVTVVTVTGTSDFSTGKTVTVSSGLATFSTVTYNKNETITIKGTATGLTATATSASITVNPAAANKLLWRTNPGTSQTAGTNWAAFSIEVTDAYGNRITTDSATKITLITITGTADFATGKTVTVSNGLGTFSTVTYNKAETIKIQGTATGLTATSTSASIIVSPALLDHYSITVTNTTILSGTGYTETNAITARDIYENLRSADATTVNMGIVAIGVVNATFYTNSFYNIVVFSYTLSGGRATIYYKATRDATPGDTFRIKATDAGSKTGSSQIITVN